MGVHIEALVSCIGSADGEEPLILTAWSELQSSRDIYVNVQ